MDEQEYGRQFFLQRLFAGRETSDNNDVEDVDDTVSHMAPEESTAYIYQVAILLTRLRLPKDIIPRILDLGEFYTSRRITHSTQRDVVTEYQSGLIHSEAWIPGSVHPKSLRVIVFETVSHDQGWSWDSANHGSYNGSCTWFEAGPVTHQTVITAAAAQRLEDDGEEDQQQQRQRQNRETTRRISTNVHASNRPKKHQARWRRDDPDPWVRNVFSRLEAGDSVAIKTCAMYPAWTNYVISTSITFEYLPVRKVP